MSDRYITTIAKKFQRRKRSLSRARRTARQQKPVTPVTLMIEYNSDTNTNDSKNYSNTTNQEELALFKGKTPKKSDRAFLEKVSRYSNSGNKNTEKVAEPDKTNNPDTKPSAVEQMLLYLMEHYHFISVKKRELYYYVSENGYWKLILPKNIDMDLREMLTINWARSINTASLSELYKWLLISAEQVDASVFYSGKHYLNFRDKAYNWKEDRFEINRKRMYFTYALNYNYPEEESNGAFNKFMNDVFEEDEDSKLEFAKFVGLALSGIRSLKYVFFLLGPSNTGKSTVLNLIKHVIGEQECSSLSFSQLSKEFFLSMLYGARMNISAEISGISVQKLDILKSLSGNDSIAASFKFQDTFAFDNKALLAFACNSLPKITDIDEFQSFASRMIIYPFYHVIARENWDTKLQEKLRKDISGLIDFAVMGLNELRENSYEVKESKAMARAKADYAGVTESFSGFCEEYIKYDVDGVITSNEIKNAYKHYCRVNDYIELKDNQWSGLLQRTFGAERSTKTITENGAEKRVRAYRGISLKKRVSDLMAKDVPKDPPSPESIFNERNIP